jgi:alpha-mannosidase
MNLVAIRGYLTNDVNNHMFEAVDLEPVQAAGARKVKKSALLLSHAHLDPAWLWEWEEGLGAALATFRSAADLCELQDGYVFNQNEALLYEWVEEYDPPLFRRIAKLVETGRWHIMGGWYLQPDCNLPAGESIARQIERGLRYFREKFGVRPRTAINFDSFGHSRGLVQLMRRFGYDSYLVCRPDNSFLPLESNEFIWEGFDGSNVLVKRIPELYNSPLGGALEYITKRLDKNPAGLECVLWGVGNHGGGPSRKDLEDLRQTQGTISCWDWEHATPEKFFQLLEQSRDLLPVVKADLNRWAVGCYTSQSLVKQGHRALENELYRAEKMTTAAAANGLMDYPVDGLREAERDLLVSEFHDILPGSSIQRVEQAGLRLIGHGREILARLSSRAFFALLAGEPTAKESTYPVFVFNPHPHEVETLIDVEFQMADQNWGECFYDVEVTDTRSGEKLLSQVERESSNMPVEWRKRVVFPAKLAPSRMNRFDLSLVQQGSQPLPPVAPDDDLLHVRAGEYDVVFSRRTGRLVSLRQAGVACISETGAGLEVVKDVPDSWVGTHTKLGEADGHFLAMNPERAAAFAGVTGPAGDGRLEAVRIIEDGPVRTVVEVLCEWGESRAQIVYRIPKVSRGIEVEVRVCWNEKDRTLKWSLGLSAPVAEYQGQTMFGSHALPTDGTECAFQQWCSAFDRAGSGVAVLNEGIYAGDCSGNLLRLTLLRSAAYSAHAWEERAYMPKDRFVPRMDQGERVFRFGLLPGQKTELITEVDRRALELNERPYSLQAFPAGTKDKVLPALELGCRSVILSSLRKECRGAETWIFRLFNPLDHAVVTGIRWMGRVLGQVKLEPRSIGLWKTDGKNLQPVPDMAGA